MKEGVCGGRNVEGKEGSAWLMGACELQFEPLLHKNAVIPVGAPFGLPARCCRGGLVWALVVLVGPDHRGQPGATGLGREKGRPVCGWVGVDNTSCRSR